MRSKLLLISLLASFRLSGFSQGYVNYDYLTSSSLKDKDGNKYGESNLQRISGRYTIPLSRTMNESKQPTGWSMTLAASYGMMDNRDGAQDWNPDRILNASLSVAHVRPLSERWSLIASLGGGIYASPDEVSWQSLLASGAFIFVYRVRDNFSVGVGGGVTNSYGIPIVMPMGYLSWRTNGQYEVLINMSDALKVQVSTHFGKNVRMQLTAMEMDGMSAVMRVDGRQKLYSSVMISSGLNVSYRLFGKASVYAGVGGMWLRTTDITDRSLKSFFKSFGDDNDELSFAPSLRLSVGLRYGF
ncbi:MAG: DUF6268 family outer membrane beta-barrel protein [Bacteroidaceae bacterium]|nr:DUF6268 family outer membrane beta-barrel protein [Bacteroidaceae bacterium]